MPPDVCVRSLGAEDASKVICAPVSFAVSCWTVHIHGRTVQADFELGMKSIPILWQLEQTDEFM